MSLFGLLAWTPRGDSVTPVTYRLRTWAVTARSLTWRGQGSGSLGRDLRRYHAATGARILTDHAFCEPLEIAYEFGALGVVAVGLASAGVVVGLRGHSPFAVGLAVWALTTCGSITGRTHPFPLLALLLVIGASL